MSSRKAQCHPERDLHARGLCNSCYTWRLASGRLETKPQVRVDVSDIELLASAQEPMHTVAKRLGYTKVDAMRRYLYRIGRADLVATLRRNSHARGLSVRGDQLR